MFSWNCLYTHGLDYIRFYCPRQLLPQWHTVPLINLVSNLCFHPIPMDWNRQLCGECKHNQFWEWVPHPASTLLLAWVLTGLCLFFPFRLSVLKISSHIFKHLIEYYTDTMSFKACFFALLAHREQELCPEKHVKSVLQHNPLLHCPSVKYCCVQPEYGYLHGHVSVTTLTNWWVAKLKEGTLIMNN